MTLHELLENAHLDALGLLDGSEQAAFERAFAAAPPGVKSQIRAEQARWAESYALLPDVEPSAKLREQVLASVGAEILKAGAGAETLEFNRPTRVARWWRPAAIGMMTAALLMGAAFVNVYQNNAEMRSRMADNGVMTDWTKLKTGTPVLSATLFDPGTNFVHFDPQTPGFEGRAMLTTNPGWKGEGRFYWQNLPSGSKFQLVVLQSGQVVRTLADLGADRAIKTISVEDLVSGMQIGVIVASDNGSLSPADILLTANI